MSIVDKSPTLAALSPIAMVAIMWESYHPRDIADAINTRFGFDYHRQWTEHHVWNARQELRGLDRAAPSP